MSPEHTMKVQTTGESEVAPSKELKSSKNFVSQSPASQGSLAIFRINKGNAEQQPMQYQKLQISVWRRHPEELRSPPHHWQSCVTSEESLPV